MLICIVEVDYFDLFCVFLNLSNGDVVNICIDNDVQGIILIGVYDYICKEVCVICVDKVGIVLQEMLNLNILFNGMYIVCVMQEGKFWVICKLIKQ